MFIMSFIEFFALFWTFVVQDGSAGAPLISLYLHSAMAIKAILILIPGLHTGETFDLKET